MDKSPEAFRTISEVAEDMDLPQHVLRFWETRFPQIKPLKRGGGRRYYRPGDIELLRAIKELLYGEGYTIKGVQKLLREQGASGLVRSAARGAREERAPQGGEAGR
jgi:DNA-binding transcriptional MerR regulator